MYVCVCVCVCECECECECVSPKKMYFLLVECSENKLSMMCNA